METRIIKNIFNKNDRYDVRMSKSKTYANKVRMGYNEGQLSMKLNKPLHSPT